MITDAGADRTTADHRAGEQHAAGGLTCRSEPRRIGHTLNGSPGYGFEDLGGHPRAAAGWTVQGDGMPGGLTDGASDHVCGNDDVRLRKITRPRLTLTRETAHTRALTYQDHDQSAGLPLPLVDLVLR